MAAKRTTDLMSLHTLPCSHTHEYGISLSLNNVHLRTPITSIK